MTICVGQEARNSPEEYAYSPLPDSHCFRVLELFPGDHDSRLECQLSIERLDDEDLLPYRAVSYTWTESKYDNLVVAGKKVTEFPGLREKYLIQHPIWINGRRLLITTNLRDALRTFRHENQSLRFWVDAICINQRDVDEQSNQVLLMPRVYHFALTIVARLQTGIQLDEAKAFVLFLQRPVFQRIWIVQELVTGRNVVMYCGIWRMPFRVLQIALDNFSRQSLDVAFSKQFSPGQNYFHCVNVIRQIQREWYLKRRNVRKRLVLATRNFLATNPKDKVFALMGLFNDFAHRDSCHLGLCEKFHSLPQIETIPALPNVTINRNTDNDFGQVSKALIGAIRELLSHERMVQQVKQERHAAGILCSLDHAQDIRHCLIEYLHIYIRGLKEFTESYSRVDFGANSTKEEGEDEEDNDEEEADGENNDIQEMERIVKHIQDFLDQEFETEDLKVEQYFIDHVTRTTQADWKQMGDLAGPPDTMELYQNAATIAMTRARYFLDLLVMDKHPNDGGQKSEPHTNSVSKK